MSHPTESEWFVCPQERPSATWRLIAFPHGGGGPHAFRDWADALPEDVELLTVHLPGRGSRLATPAVGDMTVLVDQLVEALSGCFDKPFAFVGHSVGALVAYATAHRLQELGLPQPLRVIASAHRAPHDLGGEDAMHALPEDELVDVLRRLGLVPGDALADPELLDLILPPLRADFALSETFAPAQGDLAIDAPITALGGTHDDLVPTRSLARWGDCTTGGIEVRTYEGDHFYTADHLTEIADLISTQVEGDLAALPPSVLVGAQSDHPRDATLHEMFRQQAARTPDAVALVDGQVRLTYAELDAQTDLLARHLQARGTVVDSLVGIYLGTSADFVLGYLAALKAGGAYMPIDLAYPPALLTDVLEAATPVAVVTSAAYVDQLPDGWRDRAVVLDEDWQDRAEAEGVAVLDDPASGRDLPGPDSLAYCVMSSGTTGRPKVIVCPHRGAVVSYWWRFTHLPYAEGEREACNVFFVWEVLRPMLQGATAYVIPDDVIYDPPRLADYLVEHRITRVLLTPSLLDQVLSTPGLDLDRALASVRVLYLNGEVVTTALAQRFSRRFPHVRLVNDYSISECHDVCTLDLATLDPALSPRYAPAGEPMDGVRVYLLDEDLQPVPRGAVGEIYVGGPTLARGYHGQPELTDERFVPDPVLRDGSLVFRTGDAGRILHDGRLEIHGRIAFMVKLRGYSIVPGAVESVIRGHDAVHAAAVTTLDDPETGQPEHLVAYVVLDGASGSRADAVVTGLREHLKTRLPHYAVPSYVVHIPALPIASSGKLDRRALPDPRARHRSEDAGAGTRSAAAGGLQRTVADAYAAVLGVDHVRADDNFFDLGGHSLAAARLCSVLREEHDVDVSVVDVFHHPTVRALARALGADDEAEETTVTRRGDVAHDEPIAVVGVACRFPGAPDADTFWDNLRDGVRSIRELTDEELAARGVPEEVYRDPAYRKVGALVDGVEDFEPRFWGVSRKEATLMDPQHRVFLECAWQALESAGQAPRHGGRRTGVFGGTFLPTYLLHHLRGGGLMDPRDPMEAHLTEIGNDKDYVTTRVSHLLDLQGPSVAVQTSCSTSLVAVAQACESLRSGHCDTALAGASSLTFPQAGYMYAEGHVSSEDGHCRPFDADASGTILGDGAGVVVLKRLSDAEAAGDTVLAVITGFATNNDGALKAGYSAPSVQGQTAVVTAAQAMARVSPETISYVECHGTGTLVGDPIEVRGLTTVWRRATDRTGFCAIGSVKGGIGHSNIAAGMAGLIKTVLALHHRQIPPVVDYRTPNPGLELEDSPFYVATELTDWPEPDGHPRRAGVSCFGIGGTNAHLVLEEHRPPVATEARAADPDASGRHLLPLSARTPASVEAGARALADALERRPDVGLPDVVRTLALGRERFDHRVTVSGEDVPSLVAALRAVKAPTTPVRATGDEPRVVLAFPGQGSQYPAMGRGLYEQVPEFRRAYDECCEILAAEHDVDLRRVALAEEPTPEFAHAAYLQPALFAMEYALARTLLAWGVRPTALVGHSLGEYVAATLAGVVDLRGALSLVQARAWAMEEAGPGAMLAVKCDEERGRALVADEPAVEVAVVNSPGDVVLSGEPEAVGRVAERCAAEGVACQRLRTTRAFHSPMMVGAAARVAAQAERVTLHAPRIPLLSNLTGTWMTDEEALDPGYWGRHLRGQVRFAADAATLLADGPDVVLEVGPGRTLTSLVTGMAAARDDHEPPVTVQLGRHPLQQDVSDAQVLLDGVGRLWAAGVELDWDAFLTSQGHPGPWRRVPLPGYAFDRERCWPEQTDVAPAAGPAPDRVLPLDRWTSLPSWRRTLAPATTVGDRDGSPTRWLVLTGSDSHDPVVGALRDRGDVVETIGPDDPAAATADGLTALLTGLAEGSGFPQRILDLRALDAGEQDPGLPQVSRDLAHLATAITRCGQSDPLQVWVVTDRTVQVDGEDVDPLRATLLGPALVLSQENPHVACRVVDVPPGGEGFAAVLRECTAVSPDEAAVVAWRGGRRWVPAYEPVTLPATPTRLRADGTYVVTGGLGRIGRVLAAHLLGLGAHVVLTSRRALDDEARRTLATELGAPEGRLVVRQADPAREGEIAAVLDETVARLGAVDGVFHAAGLAELTYLGELDDDLLRRELSPKVQGLLRLDDAVAGLAAQGRAPGFVMVFSSIAGTLGGLAMAAYMAANRFMDTWTQDQPRRHGVDWVCVAWDDWDFDYGKEQTAAYAATGADRFAMSPEQGLELLERVLGLGEPAHLLVSTRPLAPRVEQWVDQSEPVETTSDDAEGEGEGAGSGDGLAERMVVVYERVLGVKDINPDDDFFALGGDSLLAAQILAQLRSTLSLQGQVQLQDIFTYPSVARLADHLVEHG